MDTSLEMNSLVCVEFSFTRERDEGKEQIGHPFPKPDSSILRQSSNPICSFSMMEQVRLCAVWPMKNWLGSSMNHIKGWMTV